MDSIVNCLRADLLVMPYLFGRNGNNGYFLSGLSKLIGPENFIKEVGKINFLSSSFNLPLAYGFIVFELLLGSLLIFKLNRKLLLITMVTVILFSLYLGFKVVTQDTSDCGCFGNFIYRSNLSALIQDIFLLITAVYLYD